MYSTEWFCLLGHIFVSHVELQLGGFFALVTASSSGPVGNRC